MDYPGDPKVGLHNSKFTDGAADGSYPPSLDPASWANGITDELKAIIVAGGLVPNEANLHQVRDAITEMIAAAIAANPSLGAGDGLEAVAGLLRAKLNGATLLRDAAGLSLNLGNGNTWVGTQSGTEVPLVDAPTIAWDLAAAQEAEVTLGGHRLLGTPSNMVNGTYYSLLACQPTTGGPHSLAYSSAYTNVSGLTLGTAAGDIDHLVFRASRGKMMLVGHRGGGG